MESLTGKSAVASVEVANILLQAVQQFTSLVDASVFFAIEAENGGKYIYTKGHLKEQYDRGDLKPASSDVPLFEGSSPSKSSDVSDHAPQPKSRDLRSKIGALRDQRDPPHNSPRCSSRASHEGGNKRKSPQENSPVNKRPKRKSIETEARKAIETEVRKTDVGVGSGSPSLRACRELCIKNLPMLSCDTNIKTDMKEAYRRFNVSNVDLVGQAEDRYAIVQFRNPADALRAYKATSLLHERSQRYSIVDVSFYRKLSDQARRTLAIWNSLSCEKDVLYEQFGNYGNIIEVSVGLRSFGSRYDATVEYANIGSAEKALRKFKDHYPSSPIKLAYAKAKPTNCVWIGNLAPSVTETDIETFCRHFGRVTDVFVNRPPNHALIYFDSEEEAVLAERALRGTTVLGDNWLEVDFAGREFQNDFLDAKDADAESLPDAKEEDDALSEISGENLPPMEGGVTENGGVDAKEGNAGTLHSRTSALEERFIDRIDLELDPNETLSEEVESELTGKPRNEAGANGVDRKKTNRKSSKAKKPVHYGTGLTSTPSTTGLEPIEGVATASSETDVLKKHNLFVGNLDKSISGDHLRKHFEHFGHIEDIEVKYRGGDTAFAFIQFLSRDALVEAVDKMQGKSIGTNEIILCED